MNKFLCTKCKFCEFKDLSSVETPNCNEKTIWQIKDEGNYIVECSNFQSKNIIKCFINWVKK